MFRLRTQGSESSIVFLAGTNSGICFRVWASKTSQEDTISYNCAISACGKASQSFTAHRLIEQMEGVSAGVSGEKSNIELTQVYVKIGRLVFLGVFFTNQKRVASEKCHKPT